MQCPRTRIRILFFSILFVLNPVKARAVNPSDGPFSVHQFPIHVSDERLVQATLRLPRGLQPGQKVPVLLIFGGFESADKVLNLVHTKKPVALASFDYPFSASRKLNFPEDLKALPEAKRLFPSTVRGIVSLVNILKHRPEINPKRVIVVGASFGAPFVLAAARNDPSISGVVLVHAFGQVPQTAEHVIMRSWLPRYGWPSRPLAWFLSRLAWLFIGIEEPEDDARKLVRGQEVLMITASEDSFIPRSASDSLWSALQESKADVKRKLMATDHLMPGSEKVIDEIIHEVEGWTEAKL